MGWLAIADEFSDNLDHAGQCMFLCLRSRSNYYVVKVPCFRPTRPPIRKARKLRKDAETRVFKRIFAYEPLTASEKVFECDAVLWQRIRDTYFTDKGIWRKWLPFYGPRIVREVEVYTKLTRVRCVLLKLSSTVSIRWHGRCGFTIQNI